MLLKISARSCCHRVLPGSESHQAFGNDAWHTLRKSSPARHFAQGDQGAADVVVSVPQVGLTVRHRRDSEAANASAIDSPLR